MLTPSDLAIPLLGVYLGEMKAYVHKRRMVHSSFICNSQKLATTQMFISRRIDYQIVLYPCSGIPHSARKSNGLLIHATTQINLKTITQKIDTIHKILENINWYIVAKRRSEVAREWVQGLGEREELPRAQGIRKALRVTDMFMTLIVGMASWLNTCIKTANTCSILYVSKAIRKKIWQKEDFRVILLFELLPLEYIFFTLMITVFNSLKLSFTVSSVSRF